MNPNVDVFATIKLYTVEIAGVLVFVTWIAGETWHIIRKLLRSFWRHR